MCISTTLTTYVMCISSTLTIVCGCAYHQPLTIVCGCVYHHPLPLCVDVYIVAVGSRTVIVLLMLLNCHDYVIVFGVMFFNKSCFCCHCLLASTLVTSDGQIAHSTVKNELNHGRARSCSKIAHFLDLSTSCLVCPS